MSNWQDEQCFQAFTSKASTVSKYCADVIESSNSAWGPHLGWKATPLLLEEVLKEPILAQVHERFPIANAGVLTMPAHRSYLWHRDGDRGVSINMLISCDHPSFCLFGKAIDVNNVDFKEIKYQAETLYLFNTQWPHSVYNFEKDRYLFSIEFAQSKKELSYQQVLTWLKTQGLVRSAEPSMP